MEETVVLKLQTYLSTQARIDRLVQQVEKANAETTEANARVAKLKPLTDKLFERCQRDNYERFYGYLMDEEIRPLGLEEEAQKWLIVKRKAYLKEQAKAAALEKAQALADEETVRVIDETLKGE